MGSIAAKLTGFFIAIRTPLLLRRLCGWVWRCVGAWWIDSIAQDLHAFEIRQQIALIVPSSPIVVRDFVPNRPNGRFQGFDPVFQGGHQCVHHNNPASLSAISNSVRVRCIGSCPRLIRTYA